MIDIAAAQKELYQELCQDSGGKCFVRICSDDSALWISDLPRLGIALPALQERFARQGLAVLPDASRALCRLDWTAEAWQSRLEGLPSQPPPLPANAELHPAYALCRLLLMHPAPLERQPMEMVRRVLKLTVRDGALKRAIPALHSLCAQRLRRGEALSSAAGGILAAWLAGQEQKGETV